MTLTELKTKVKSGQVLAKHKTRKDNNGKPLYGIFPEKDFAKDYGKYDWTKTSTKKAPVPPADKGDAKTSTKKAADKTE